MNNAAFQIEITDAVGGAPGAMALSLVRAETPAFGGTIYGDFLGAGAIWILGLTTSGTAGSPGGGTANLAVPIPNNPALIGLTMYWQGFVADSNSPLSIGLAHTGGLAITVVQ